MASTDFLHDDEIEFGTPKKTVYEIEESRGNGLEDHMYAWNRNELIYEIDAALGPVDCTYKRYYFDPDTSELYQVSYGLISV